VPEQAAALLRRALAEPPAAELRTTLLSELGAAALAALEPDAAEHIARAIELTTDLDRRSQLADLLGMAHTYADRSDQAVDVLLAAIDEVHEEPRLRERWLALEAMVARVGGESLETRERVRGRIHDLAATLAGETAGERLVRSFAALERPGPKAEDLFRATREAELAMDPAIWPNPAAQAPNVLSYIASERPDAARELAEKILDEGSAGAAPFRYALGLYCRGLVAAELGELPAAEADLRAALELTGQLDLATRAPAIGYLLQSLVAQGRFEAAGELLSGFDLEGTVPERLRMVPVLFGRGAWHAASRRWHEAASDFRELGRRLQAWEIDRPTPPWRSSLALALVALDAQAEAREIVDEELALARRWDGPRAIAVASRAKALVEGGEAAIEGLAEAVALLDETPWRLDRAQTRCDLGSALRRAGRRRDGREQLAVAMDEANTCGAEPLVQRAADELRASGARPRRRALSGLEALTPSEHRVATLAAAGKTNRGIAQELFVTLATVETHLTRAYRKLDIKGREQLDAALAARPSSDIRCSNG
jgi:DNA-binding CsgD family transcriptional regulator